MRAAEDAVVGRFFGIRGAVGAELFGNGGADQGDSIARRVIGVREIVARLQRIVVDRHVLRHGADHADVQVLAPVLDLEVARELRDDRLERRDVFVHHGVVVVDLEADAHIARHARPAAEHLSGVDAEEVGAQRLDLVRHRFLGTGAQRHHGYHRGDADDDAEHREQRAELVGPDRRERDREDLAEKHV